MKKLHLLLVLGSMVPYWTQAQPTFVKILDGGGSAQFNLHELVSGNIYAGLAPQSGTSLITPTGNIIQSRSYVVDTFLVLQAVKKHTDNEFYFVGGYHKDSCTTIGDLVIPHTYPVVGKMDSLGNIIHAHSYTINASNCSNTAGDLYVMNDGSVITWGTRHNRFFALRAEGSGAPLWAMRFNENGAFQFIKELPGGDLLAGINMDSAGAVVARMDADGNFIWCKSYIRPRGMVHDAVIESDDSFIITGYTDSTTQNMFIPLPSDFQPKLFMMKLDGEGDVQWCRGYGSAPNFWHTPRNSRIERTLDGNYALIATLGVPGYNFFERPLLMKTDVSGDTLWTRSVGRNGYSYYTMDLLAYSDGGFLISGGIWGDLPDQNTGLPYIFKTDSLGHFSCWERHQSVELLDLFPTDSSFTLTSIDGAEMYPAFVRDTIFDPLTVYSGCTFTTGIPRYQDRRPRIYPNPNTGRFTVQFADPLLAESYYSVYDTMGKLLVQRRLPTGATVEEVDLARYGAGTYVVKFTSPDGVCHERVVVE